MNKKSLSERDICTKFISPAILEAGWDVHTQLREEVSLTSGRVVVRGKRATRDADTICRADYVLSFKPGIPLAVVEAKDNHHNVRAGMQQALRYAEMLDVPFAFSSNGDGFVWHDRTAADGVIERELTLAEFPSPAVLWQRYLAWKGITPEAEPLVAQDYYPGKEARYYQLNAVNRAVEAVTKGKRSFEGVPCGRRRYPLGV